MPNDNVLPLHESVVISDGKQSLLDYLAQAHDELASKSGESVVAVVFAFVGADGACRPGYYTLDSVRSRNALYIARGAQGVLSRAEDWA